MNKAKNTKIAVVGMACFYPGARNIGEFWENVLSKRRGFRRFQDTRFSLEDYFDSDKKAPGTKLYIDRAAVIDGFNFDALHFRIPKDTFKVTDLAHWIALSVTEKAVEDAGPIFENKDRVGTVIGNSLTGETIRAHQLQYRWPFFKRVFLNASKELGLSNKPQKRIIDNMEKILESIFPGITEDSLAGQLANTIPGRICNHFDWHGAGYNVDGACSSSLIAVATACDRLAMNANDVVLAGGVDISLDPMELVGFAKTGALTDSDMQVYDRRGNGFIPGEGCGIVVLKRLSDAEKDGNKIYAVIQGWGLSSDGRGGIMQPTVRGQALALERAYNMAEYDMSQLDFIEGHGTGTTVGDEIELKGIEQAYLNNVKDNKLSHKIGITSVKSIIGHTKAAAGVAAFIKSILAVNARVLPPTTSCYKPHAAFKDSHLYPIRTGRCFKKNNIIRAGVSAMGFGGINSHVTLESWKQPQSIIKSVDNDQAVIGSSQESEIFLIEAMTIPELILKIDNLSKEIRNVSVSELVDLSAEMVRQVSGTLPIRLAFLSKSIGVKEPENLFNLLQEIVSKLKKNPPKRGSSWHDKDNTVWVGNDVKKNRIGFLFPGQGSQRLMVGYKHFLRNTKIQELVASSDIWAKEVRGGKISSILYPEKFDYASEKDIEKYNNKLKATNYAQPIICLSSLIHLHILNDLGIHPTIVGGHSLGELTSLYCAGAFNEQTLIKVAQIRGLAMHKPSGNAGGMLSIAGSIDVAEELCKQVNGYVVVANLNTPVQTIVSGEVNAIEQVVKLAAKKGILTIRIPVSCGFHSKLVSSASEKIRDLKELPDNWSHNKIKVLSSVSGDLIDDSLNVREYLTNQITSPVNFISLAEKMKESTDIIIEVGPGRVLSNLLKNINNNEVQCLPLASELDEADADLNQVLATLFTHGVEINWSALFKGRFYRTYVKPSDRLFISNPCETPIDMKLLEKDKGEMSSVGLAYNVGTSITSFLESLEFKTQDIENRVVKPVQEKVSGEDISIVTDKKLSARPITQTSKKVKTVSTQESKVDLLKRVKEDVFDIVSARTGYPMDAITMDSNLLDHLNINSIKATDIITSVSKKFSVEDKIDASKFAASDLKVIIDSIAEIAKPITIEQETEVDAESDFVQVEVQSNELQQKGAEMEHKMHISKEQIVKIVVGQIVKQTGFPEDSVLPESRLLDDFNINSIKATDILTKITSRLDIVGKIDAGTFANASVSEISEAIKRVLQENMPDVQPVSPSTRVIDVLIHTASKITGFPISKIKPSSLIMNDLGFHERRKQEQLFGEVAKIMGFRLNADLDILGKRTLEDVATVFENLKKGSLGTFQKQQIQTTSTDQNVDQSEKHSKVDNILYSLPGWIRNYEVDFLPEDVQKEQNQEYVLRKEDNWNQIKVLIISDKNQSLSKHLGNRFESLGSIVTFTTYQEIERFQEKISDFYHIISILPDKPSSKDPREQVKNSLNKLLKVAHCYPPQLSNEVHRRRTTMVFVQFGGGYFGTGENKVDFETSCASAFARDFHMEREDLRIRVIDLCTTIEKTTAAELISSEITSSESFRIVGFDSNRIKRVMKIKCQDPKKYTPRKIRWSKNDVVIITGGGKGVTAECALEFAQLTGVKVALIGTSKLGSGDQSKSSAIELTKNIERFSDKKIVFKYYSCDVTDELAVEDMVKRVTNDLGTVTGLIHGAGIMAPRTIRYMTLDRAIRDVGPKLIGAQNLVKSLFYAPLKLIVGFTSLSAKIGVPGNAIYSYSNEALNLIFKNYIDERSDVQLINIAWGLWDEVGGGEKVGMSDNLKSMGLYSYRMPINKAVKRFLELVLKDPGENEVVVTGRMGGFPAWEKLRNDKFPIKVGRFAEEFTHFEPGIELVMQSHLTLDKDLYVSDHIFQGSYLIPSVISQEIAAQAASSLIARKDYEIIRIENIELLRPIIMDANDGLILKSHALRYERVDSDEIKVYVAIHSESTAYKQIYYKADYYLGIRKAGGQVDIPELTKKPLDINVKDVYYGRNFFVGPIFQRIQKIFALNEKRSVSVCNETELGFLGKEGFGEDYRKPMQLGDPYFREGLSQSSAISKTQHIPVPRSVERIDFYKRSDKNNNLTLGCVSSIKESSHKHFIADMLATDNSGNVIEKWTNSRAYIIGHHPEWPSIEQLTKSKTNRLPIDDSNRVVKPKELESYIKDVTKQYNVKCPKIICSEISDLMSMKTIERRAKEKEYIESMIYSKNKVLDKNKERLIWLSSGKPKLNFESIYGNDISISNEDNYFLSVIGDFSQGCDLALVLIDKSKKEEWNLLLGKDRKHLLDSIYNKEKSVSHAGTRVWGLIEALGKSRGSLPVSFSISNSEYDPSTKTFYFAISIDENIYHVISTSIRFSKGSAEYVLTFLVSDQNIRQQIKNTENVTNNIEGNHSNLRTVFNKDLNCNQLEYSVQVSYKEASTLSKRVHFVHYVHWLGKMRELSLGNENGRKFIQEVLTGDIGAVTNNVDLWFFNEATSYDEICMKLIANELTDTSGSIFVEYSKKDSNNNMIPIALGSNSFSYTGFDESGIARPLKWPDSWILDKYFPKDKQPIKKDDLIKKYPLLKFDVGETLYTAPNTPYLKHIIEVVFKTTLEDSNLVGNLYYSKYVSWQGQVIDQFLFNIDPKLFDSRSFVKSKGEQGDLFCHYLRMEYLRDVHPFEDVKVRLIVKSVTNFSAEFYFEFYFKDNLIWHKASVGKQHVFWVGKDKIGNIEPRPWPKKVLKQLLKNEDS